ncbi:MAG: hypothetical protein WA741_19795, partial [Candidatus Sulfotelmatobacter sp.]
LRPFGQVAVGNGNQESSSCRSAATNQLFLLIDWLCGSNLAVSLTSCITPMPSQVTAFDGVIIAASMSSCAARRSSLMLWA